MPTYDGYYQPANVSGSIDNLRNSLVSIYGQNNQLRLQRELGNRGLDIQQQQADQTGKFQTGTLENQGKQLSLQDTFNQGTLAVQNREVDLQARRDQETSRRNKFLESLEKEAHDAAQKMEALNLESKDIKNQDEFLGLQTKVRAYLQAEETAIGERGQEILDKQFNGDRDAMATDPAGLRHIQTLVSDMVSSPSVQTLGKRTDTSEIQVAADDQGLLHIVGKDNKTGKLRPINPENPGLTYRQSLDMLLSRVGPDTGAVNLASLNLQEAQNALAKRALLGQDIFGENPETTKQALAAPVGGNISDTLLQDAETKAANKRATEPQRIQDNDAKIQRSIEIVHDKLIPNNSDAGTGGGFLDNDFEVFAGNNDADAQGRKSKMATYAQSTINQKPGAIARVLGFPTDDPAKWDARQLEQATQLIIESQRKKTRASGLLSRPFNDLGAEDLLPSPTQREFLEAAKRLGIGDET